MSVQQDFIGLLQIFNIIWYISYLKTEKSTIYPFCELTRFYKEVNMC